MMVSFNFNIKSNVLNHVLDALLLRNISVDTCILSFVWFGRFIGELSLHSPKIILHFQSNRALTLAYLTNSYFIHHRFESKDIVFALVPFRSLSFSFSHSLSPFISHSFARSFIHSFGCI